MPGRAKRSGVPAMIFALVAALLCCLNVRANDKTNALAMPELVVPKAVFVNDLNIGRDPFFPTSTRRKDSLPRIANVTTTNVVPVPAIPLDLKLKGIAGTKEQRLALINSVTVASGETAHIKCLGGQIAKILCREIRDDSVLIELVPAGEVRELKLREGI